MKSEKTYRGDVKRAALSTQSWSQSFVTTFAHIAAISCSKLRYCMYHPETKLWFYSGAHAGGAEGAEGARTPPLTEIA